MAVVPAAAGIGTFPFGATEFSFPRVAEFFCVVDVRRTLGVFRIFIPAGGPSASGDACVLLLVDFVFLGTAYFALIIPTALSFIGGLASAFWLFFGRGVHYASE